MCLPLCWWVTALLPPAVISPAVTTLHSHCPRVLYKLCWCDNLDAAEIFLPFFGVLLNKPILTKMFDHLWLILFSRPVQKTKDHNFFFFYLLLYLFVFSPAAPLHTH